MSSGAQPKHLRVGVVLFPDALPLEPTCLLNALSPSRLSKLSSPLLSSSDPAQRTRATFECIHIAESFEPVKCSFGTTITPDQTFADVQKAFEAGSTAERIDIMLLPGGQGARPWNASEGLKGFVKWAAGNVDTTLTVCTGSWLLASTGALAGQRATTNKKAFLECQKYTQDQGEGYQVEWVPHARWVVSGRFYTASGVSAGMDMACAFIDQVAGEAAGMEARSFAEYTSNSEGDDPWATASGLA